MIPIIPFFFLGGSFLLFASKSKKKVAAKFRIIDSGPVENLPKVGKPVLSTSLRVGEAINIMAIDSAAQSWKVTRRGVSVKMVREWRRGADMVTFSFQAMEEGVTLATFERVNRRGEIVDARRLEIVVE